MLPIAILCGGLGTRMRSIAADIPKALIPVCGEPFIFHQLRWLKSSGSADVVLCVGYGAQAIRTTVGDGSRFGLRISYSDDGAQLRGTAGSLARAVPLLGERFLTIYGDSILQCDPISVSRDFEASNAAGLMTVFRNDDRLLPSNVRVEGAFVVAYDKQARLGTMTHIDYGLNAFTAASFANVEADQRTDLSEVHAKLVRAGSLRAYSVTQRFYEIGSPKGLRETERFLACVSRTEGGHRE